MIRERCGVGSALRTLVVEGSEEVLGSLGAAADHRSRLSERGKACVSSAQPHVRKGPRELLGAKDLLCFPKYVKSVNAEAQPGTVCQETD